MPTPPSSFAALAGATVIVLGVLIAREAGARTGHLYPCPTGIPEDLYGENILVSAPEIHAELGDLLRAADANELRYD